MPVWHRKDDLKLERQGAHAALLIPIELRRKNTNKAMKQRFKTVIINSFKAVMLGMSRRLILSKFQRYKPDI